MADSDLRNILEPHGLSVSYRVAPLLHPEDVVNVPVEYTEDGPMISLKVLSDVEARNLGPYDRSDRDGTSTAPDGGTDGGTSD